MARRFRETLSPNKRFLLTGLSSKPRPHFACAARSGSSTLPRCRSAKPLSGITRLTRVFVILRGRQVVGLVAGLVSLAAIAPAIEAQIERFDRVEAARLELPFPGTAVVRDSARWATLWYRFGDPGTAGGFPSERIPAIDFVSEIVVVVAARSTSGCSNRASLVREVTQTRDSLVVRVGPPPGDDGGVTCGMIVHPLEVVKLPGAGRPVVVTGPDEVATWPEWWDQFTPEELAQLPERRRQVFLHALAGDPATSHSTISAIANMLSYVNWIVVKRLMNREDVRSDPSILTRLAGLERGVGENARRVLFDRFGLQLSQRHDTPLGTLRVLLQEFAYRDPPSLEMSRALLRHPGVLEDRGLLIQLARELSLYPELRTESCREIFARYPVWDRLLDSDGNQTDSWGSRVPCPNLPPPPDADSIPILMSDTGLIDAA